jgi:hypothetical protein
MYKQKNYKITTTKKVADDSVNIPMRHGSIKYEINQDPKMQVVRCFLALGNEPPTISKMILSSKSTRQAVYEINLPSYPASRSITSYP